MFHVGYRLGMDAERFANKRWARQSVFLFCDANFQKAGARITLTNAPIASPQELPKSFMLMRTVFFTADFLDFQCQILRGLRRLYIRGGGNIVTWNSPLEIHFFCLDFFFHKFRYNSFGQKKKKLILCHDITRRLRSPKIWHEKSAVKKTVLIVKLY